MIPTQRFCTLPYDTNSTVFANIGIHRHDNSNAISRELGEKFLFGGHIDAGMKDRVYQNLDPMNNYGASSEISADFIYFPDGKEVGFGVGYEFTSYQSLQFTADLFELVFYGNQGFNDRPADLSGTTFRNYNAHRISFTAVQKSTGSFVSLGLYSGLRYSESSVNTGDVRTHYSDVNGETVPSEVDIYALGFYAEDFTSDRFLQNDLGLGVSMGVNWNIGKHQFSAQAKDIGVIHVSGAEIRDTSGTFTFSGINWDLGSNSNPGDVFETLEDSLSPSQRTSSGKLRMLPAQFKLHYFTPLSQKFSIAATGRYVFDLEFEPEITAALNYHINTANTLIWLDGSLGGYNFYSFGLGAQVDIGNSSIISIGTRHATGLFYREASAFSASVKYALRL
ncbi:MAG: hypothetical protein LC664_04265 [Flavobacteriales bacterium]|nr:hypothetical protein [Flavobacteriales bacterium]